MCTWHRPNDFFSIIRCNTRKYSEKLIDKGSIKFNTPQSWVTYEKENNKGRGDILEGVFASCSFLDIKSITHYSKLYDDVYGETINRLVYFRRRRTMNLPCYCFYLLKVNSLKTPKKEGKQNMSAIIDGKYFRDFADNASKEDIENLKYEDRPSIVAVHDSAEFVKRIIDKLVSLGLDRTEIIYHMIEYNNKKTPFHCTKAPPNELKIKDNDFSYQQEGRIIVDTNKTSILKYLQNNPIEIGPIDDISKKVDSYLDEGMIVELTADVYKIEE